MCDKNKSLQGFYYSLSFGFDNSRLIATSLRSKISVVFILIWQGPNFGAELL